MEYKTIILEKKENIATITLNRPQKMNAVSPTMNNELEDALLSSDRDDETRVVVITATGRAFCSGIDVRESFQTRIDKREAGEGEDVTGAPTGLYSAFVNLKKPLIASVNGFAIGFGLNMALVCDIRIASEAAKFQYAFTRMGVISGFSITYLLPRLIGIERACELAFTAKMIDAQEAKEMGLVSHIVPADQLAKATYEMASSIAKLPPLAIRLVKRGFYLGMNADRASQQQFEHLALNYLHGTEDHKEATKAFLEKREPIFKGR